MARNGKGGFRVFVSAVSGELASYREEVARVLRRKKLEVRDQRHFRQGGATLVEGLRDYIQECDAVVLLVGERCGAFPTDEHVAALGPVAVFDQYREKSGQPRASYTQWEYLLAKHLGKDTYVFFTEDGFVPDEPNSEDADLSSCQQAYRHWIDQTGEHRNSLTTPEKLIEDVLVLPFPDLSKGKPIWLPFPTLGPLFKGREEFLDRLHRILGQGADGQGTAIVGKALHGLGGVGKTRLAVEYGWRHLNDYSAVLFVSAETPQDLQRNLAGLCGPRVLDLWEQQAPEEQIRIAAVLRWLQAHPGWLLIMDNADTTEAAAAAEEWLARLHGGMVVVTSRRSQWSASVEELELDVLETEEASRFLIERTDGRRRGLSSDVDDAAALAEELGGLALALEQAGAYIARHRKSLAEYLEDWRAHVPAVQEWHDPRLMHYPRSVAVTWETTLGALGAGEIALLRLCAWLAPESIPLFVIEGEAGEALWQEAVALLQSEIPALPQSEGNVLDALATLADYSMVRWDADADTAEVHRVVQEILRTRVPEGNQTAWLMLALRLLIAARPGDPTDVRTWDRWETLQPHVAIAVTRADEQGISDLTPGLMNELALLLETKAQLAEAEPLMRRALAIDEQCFGEEHPNVARDLSILALLLKDTSRLAEAEILMRRALAIDKQRFGEDHPNVAIRLNNLAQLLQATNRLDEAETLMKRTLAMAEQSAGDKHPSVAIRLNNLAALLQDTNRMAEAEPLMRRALAIVEQCVGPGHPDVANNLNNLATLLLSTNRLAEAEPLMRRALAITEQCFGGEHPRVATNLNNLAALLKDTNRLKEAERLIRRALAIDEQFFGAGHPDVARDLNNLASLLQATNRLAEAEPLMRRALAIDEQSFGDGHPRVALQLSNLAQLLKATKRLDEAESLMRRALAIDEGLGQEHPSVARDLNNLAQLLKATNRLADAEPLMRRMVGILIAFTRRTAHEHPHLQTALANYAGLLKMMGRDEPQIQHEISAMVEAAGLNLT